tara:strand:+ start:173 stop:712 length:540 start_codon:yes stop_codon:yes gene_type:complete
MGIHNENDKRDREEYVKKLSENYNMKDINNYFPYPMNTIFGLNSIVIDEEKETIDQKRAYIDAQSPVIAMALYWDSLWQQAMVTIVHAQLDMVAKAFRSKHGEVLGDDIDELVKVLKSDTAVDAMFQAFYGSVPDIINIGNPMLVGNVVAKSEKDVEEGEFKQAVDDLIKDVFKKDEEE